MKIVRYKLPLAAATLLGAFFLERAAAAAVFGQIRIPPLLVIAMLAWFPALALGGRLWSGAAVGFLNDLAGDVPFGTTILLAMTLAFLTEFLQSVISHRESYPAKAAIFVLLLSAAFILSPILRKFSSL